MLRDDEFKPDKVIVEFFYNVLNCIVSNVIPTFIKCEITMEFAFGSSILISSIFLNKIFV